MTLIGSRTKLSRPNSLYFRQDFCVQTSNLAVPHLKKNAYSSVVVVLKLHSTDKVFYRPFINQ